VNSEKESLKKPQLLERTGSGVLCSFTTGAPLEKPHILERTDSGGI